MVRVDHEDGGVLNPDDDDTSGDTPQESAESTTQKESTEKAASEQATPVVRKSSPLGRKPNKRKRPDKPAADKPADDKAAEDKAADGKPADDEVADDDKPADEVETSSASYRDRRIGAQKRRTAREAAVQNKRSAVDANAALKVTALVTGVLVLVAGVIMTIFFALGYQRIDHTRELRAEYAGFARQVVVQMTTLDSENADAMYELAMEKTSGRAQQVFRDNMKQVTEMIREGDAVTKTTVLTEAVSEATDDEGTVLMVVGWESRSKDGSQEPLFQTFRYQVGMTRINGELKVTDLEFVW